MIKKITTLFFACFALTISAQAQYNLFDAADVDADGWIWFDTQEKIDKYISQADNAAYKVDPNGKIIQLIGADFGEYEDSTADPDFIGTDKDGILGGTGAKRGVLALAPAQSASGTDGGGIVVRLTAACASFNVSFSSEARLLGRLLGSTTETVQFKDYTVITVKNAPPFAQIGSIGQKEWVNMEQGTNGGKTKFGLKSATPMYAKVENCNKYPLYIHGMKILTSTPTTGINSAKADSSISFDGKTLTVSAPADLHVYSVTGQLIASDYTASMNLSNFAKGIYIVKANTGSTQETAKIAIQ